MSRQPTAAQLAAAGINLYQQVSSILNEATSLDYIGTYSNAAAIVGKYQLAIKEAPSKLPDAQALAISCSILLLMSNTHTKDDWIFLTRIYTPEMGINLTDIAAEIDEIRRRVERHFCDTENEHLTPPSSGDAPSTS